jgi:cyanoexosortase B-associated protein
MILTSLLPPSWSHRWVRLGLVIVLAGLAAVASLPAYGNGPWPWTDSPQVQQLEHLHQLSQRGLSLPGWSLVTLSPLAINHQEWTLAEYVSMPPAGTLEGNTSQPIVILMLPQSQPDDSPGVEWLDIEITQDLRFSRQRQIILTGIEGQHSSPARARLSQSRSRQHTFATLQWYAWPQGGHPSPSRWFWHDQGAQLIHHTRIPWVAVNVFIPMDPLAELDAYQPLALEIGNLVQARLMASGFQVPSRR